MPPEPRVCVGTLYSGEREFERACAALREQTHRRFEHLVLRDLPNKEAHDRLYRSFMEAADDFDLFVKLDADMVLRHPRVLEGIVERFRSDPELDHLELTVLDWFTRAPMMGLHAFSRRARWQPGPEGLFVDPAPRVPGRRRVLRTEPAPAALHAPDPSPEQAWTFGVHRALKALQPGRPAHAFQLGQSVTQFRILRRTWEHYRDAGDPRLALALLGAEEVLAGRAGTRIADREEVVGRRETGGRFPEPSEAELRGLARSWSRPRLREGRHRVRMALRHLRGRIAPRPGPPLEGAAAAQERVR